jgi:diacylglycerol kinase (ATP)
VAQLAAAHGIPLAVVALGTANDFARAHGLPREVGRACELAVRGGRIEQLELAWMGERPFVNVASAGLAVSAALRARAWKKRLHALAYPLAASWSAALDPPVECSVSCDGAPLYAGPAWQVIVAASGHFGAGARVSVADPADGRLDVTVIQAGARARLAARAWGLKAGRITTHAGVHHRRGDTVIVDVAPDTAYNVDGEIVPAGAASFSVQHEAFGLVSG